MRKINTSDVFKCARIIKNANMKDELAEIYNKFSIVEGDDANIEKAGIQIVLCVIGGCSDERQEKAIYELIGGIIGKDAQLISDQTIEDTIDDIKKIAKENNLVNFSRVPTTSADRVYRLAFVEI